MGAVVSESCTSGDREDAYDVICDSRRDSKAGSDLVDIGETGHRLRSQSISSDVPLPLVIAVDIDDTLVHSVDSFQKWCVKRQNQGKLPRDWSADSEREAAMAELSAPVSPNRANYLKSQAFRELPPIPGALTALKDLKAAGFQLETVSARDSNLSDITEGMLNKLYPEIFWNHHYSDNELKGLSCSTIGAKVLIDDSVAHLADAVKYGLVGILFDYEGRYTWTQGKTLPNGVTRLHTWPEIARWIKQYNESLRVDAED